MAYYNSYLPQNYYQGLQMPPQGPQIAPNAQAQQNNQITWVQGEAAAKAYPVGAGQSVLLMDSEDSIFYIKSTDQSGMPQPLRTFEYSEKAAHQAAATAASTSSDEFVTRSEFDEFREDVKRAIKGVRKPKVTDEAGDG